MDYYDIHQEYESISIASRQSLESISNINLFYKSVYKYAELFYHNTRKAIENFFNEQIKIDTKSTLSKNMFEFYRNYEDFMIKLKNILNKFNKDIVDPLGIFHINLCSIFSECLEDLKNIENTINESKRNLEKVKLKYYESCKLVAEQEKTVCKTFSGKIINTDDDINQAHDNLLKIKSQSENLAQMYKYELTKVNKIIDENEKKYVITYDKLRANEESRIYFMKCNMEKFSKIYEEFAVSSFDFLNRLNTTLVEIKVDEDIKLFTEKYMLKENTLRFPKEDFVSYDTYKKSLDSPIPVIYSEENNSNPLSSNSPLPLLKKGSIDSLQYNKSTPLKSPSKLHSDFTMSNLTEDFEVITDYQVFSEKYQENLIDNLLIGLFSEKEIEAESMSKFMEVLYEHQSFAKLFIDSILNERKNIFLKLSNYNNLQHFANILNTISLNIDNIEDENYDLNFAIIFIAERTFCLIKNGDLTSKIYLSAILSKNKLYSTRSFWFELIDLKLQRRIDEQMLRYDRSFPEKHLPIEPTDSIFTNIGAKLKNIFNTKDNMNQSSIYLNTAPNNTRSLSINKNLENISANKKVYLDKITTSEVSSIIKEYIPHFANFNFEISEAIDVIVELSTKYKLSKEKISYFVTYLNSCVFSVKNKFLNSSENIEHKKIKNSSYIVKTNDYKITILSSSIKYLHPSEYINIFLPNKNCYSKINKKVYKFTLQGNIKHKTRLSIWNCLLRINSLKKKFGYKSILEEIETKKAQNDKFVISFSDMIELDVQRTFFETNIEQSRSAIGNILKGVALLNPKINYCQGMNYIASFLYRITNNEEEAFYLMAGLFKQTDFSLIFVDDLLKLKNFFYVFDRLLSLYLPELYSHFKSNSVNVNFFCSPWFITLFTNSVSYISLQDPPLVLLKIWDDFLLNGWIALMRTSLYLLKTYESMLITLKYEDLLHFLINDLTKTGFFMNNNLPAYLNLMKNTKIKSELISNLENEFIQNTKFKEDFEKIKK